MVAVTSSGLIAGLIGALGGLGLAMAIAGMLRRRGQTPVDGAGIAAAGPRSARRLAVSASNASALCAGTLALIVTRWPMSFPLGVLAVLGMRGLGTSGATASIERLEAIASWTEMLRDTLAGASGITQALIATSAIAPVAIRETTRSMAAKLASGVALHVALAEMADDLDDPAADVVAASLILASRERAQRLGELLGALATSTREEVTMRLGVEASRASSRAAVRMITGFSFGLFALMAVFAKSYLSPYRSLTGQLVLGVVGCLFGLGLWLMSLMVRPRLFPRLPLAPDA